MTWNYTLYTDISWLAISLKVFIRYVKSSFAFTVAFKNVFVKNIVTLKIMWEGTCSIQIWNANTLGSKDYSLGRI